MIRVPAKAVLKFFLSLVLATVLVAGCGGGPRALPQAREALDDWVRIWRVAVRPGEVPNAFRIPAPPVIELSPTALEIGRDVRRAALGATGDAPDVHAIGVDESRQVFCTWFGWYVQTGNVVPTEQEFPALLLTHGFRRIVTEPPEQQFRDAADLLRASIERAQTEDGQVRNAAAAAVCSVP